MSEKVTILYLDDEEVNLFIFKSSFKSDFNVITTTSPEEAIQQIANNDAIKAVVSDMRMPVMNGVEFISKVRTAKPKIPCYILTGFDFNEEINAALNAGVVSRSFEKPFDKEVMTTHILNEAV
jgi:two-component system response regulator (stage 0 sporulation protein F)